jgi:hypothetical protein
MPRVTSYAIRCSSRLVRRGRITTPPASHPEGTAALGQDGGVERVLDDGLPPRGAVLVRAGWQLSFITGSGAAISCRSAVIASWRCVYRLQEDSATAVFVRIGAVRPPGSGGSGWL